MRGSIEEVRDIITLKEWCAAGGKAPGLHALPVDKHADIDDLAVPDERRPLLRAPILKLFGYLIRELLRKWAKRLEKAKS